jgi:hypothetical protein
MVPTRPNSTKNVSPVSDALTGLVRLLARQAARETIQRHPDPHHLTAVMTSGAENGTQDQEQAIDAYAEARRVHPMKQNNTKYNDMI